MSLVKISSWTVSSRSKFHLERCAPTQNSTRTVRPHSKFHPGQFAPTRNFAPNSSPLHKKKSTYTCQKKGNALINTQYTDALDKHVSWITMIPKPPRVISSPRNHLNCANVYNTSRTVLTNGHLRINTRLSALPLLRGTLPRQ